jgi:hypothetical protein
MVVYIIGIRWILRVFDAAAAAWCEAATQNLHSPHKYSLPQSSKVRRSRNANLYGLVSSKGDCFFEQRRYPALPLNGEFVSCTSWNSFIVDPSGLLRFQVRISGLPLTAGYSGHPENIFFCFLSAARAV